MQTGAGITHRAEFLLDLLSGLKITAKTLDDLMVRAVLHCTHALLSRARCQYIINAAVDQLAGDAAEAGRKTVRLCRAQHTSLAHCRMQGGRASHHRLHALGDALRIAFRRARCGVCDAVACVTMCTRRSEADKTLDAYRVHIQPGDKRTGGPCLSYWCMVPGVTMRELQAEGVKSIVLTSGTLSPMESFAHELVRCSRAPRALWPLSCVARRSKLGFRSASRTRTSSPRLRFARPGASIASPTLTALPQLWAGVMAVGPSGVALNSSFRTRDTPEYKLELGCAIENVARVVPDGLLIFFPSYSVMSGCLDAWQAPGNPSVWCVAPVQLNQRSLIHPHVWSQGPAAAT